MSREINKSSAKALTQQQLSPAARLILKAVDDELPEVFQRQHLNKLSPSFPWNFRTLANRDSLARRRTGQPLIQQTQIDGRTFYIKASFMDVLRAELTKEK